MGQGCYHHQHQLRGKGVGLDVDLEDLTPEAAALILTVQPNNRKVAQPFLHLCCLSWEMETAFSAFSGILQRLPLMDIITIIAMISIIYTTSHLGCTCVIIWSVMLTNSTRTRNTQVKTCIPRTPVGSLTSIKRITYGPCLRWVPSHPWFSLAAFWVLQGILLWHTSAHPSWTLELSMPCFSSGCS